MTYLSIQVFDLSHRTEQMFYRTTATLTAIDVAREQLHGAIMSFYDLLHDEQPESASLDRRFVGSLGLLAGGWMDQVERERPERGPTRG
jgi:hypothetical protein